MIDSCGCNCKYTSTPFTEDLHFAKPDLRTSVQTSTELALPSNKINHQLLYHSVVYKKISPSLFFFEQTVGCRNNSFLRH